MIKGQLNKSLTFKSYWHSSLTLDYLGRLNWALSIMLPQEKVGRFRRIELKQKNNYQHCKTCTRFFTALFSYSNPYSCRAYYP